MITTATLYNRIEEKDENMRTVVRWQRTAIKRCICARKTVRSLDNGTARVGETLVCNIPSSRAYMPPDEWAASSEREGRFTLWAGDIIVFGEVADEIGPSLAESALRGKYARVGAMIVSSAKDCTIRGNLGCYMAEGV